MKSCSYALKCPSVSVFRGYNTRQEGRYEQKINAFIRDFLKPPV